MKTTKLFLILLLSIGASACGGGSSGSSSSADESITFTILLSSNCAGVLSTARIIFDDVQVAVLTPGGSTDVTTTRGTHRIEAIGNTGGTVGPLSRDIQNDGGSETLSCS